MKKQEKKKQKSNLKKKEKDKKDYIDKWLEFFEYYKKH